jgi:hypothetical protein
MKKSALPTVAPFSPSERSQPAIADQGRTDDCLLRAAYHTLGALAPMQHAFDRARKFGVPAASACDYNLFNGMTDLIDPQGEGSGFGEPFDDSPWTAQACAKLIDKLSRAPVYLVSETVWVAEWRGATVHRLEVILPRLLPDPARTAWWASAALNQMTLLDEEGWLKGPKRAPERIEYDARTTPWSILAFYLPPLGLAKGHWACRRRLSKRLVPMLLRVQKGLESFDGPRDHACFETTRFFSAARYLGQGGMTPLQ